MATNLAEIELKATDNATGALESVRKKLEALEKQAGTCQQALERLSVTLGALGRLQVNLPTSQITAFRQEINNLVGDMSRLHQIRVNLSGLGTANLGTGNGPNVTEWNQGLSLIRQGWQTVREAVGVAMEAVNAFIETQKMATTFKFSFGGDANKAREEMDYARGTADRLGLSLLETSRSYGKLAAAARGTTLEGEGTRKIFTAISAASTTMGLSVYETEGALRAVGQMISKGTVQSEELRGQLGERLPGAFGIAARAMGVTTAELGKMLEQGQVISSEFLPKFADELLKTLGDAPKDAAVNLNAEINRMNTAFFDLKATIGELLSEDVTGWVKGIAASLKDMTTWVKENQKELKLMGEIIKGLADISLPRLMSKMNSAVAQGAKLAFGPKFDTSTAEGQVAKIDDEIAAVKKQLADSGQWWNGWAPEGPIKERLASLEKERAAVQALNKSTLAVSSAIREKETAELNAARAAEQKRLGDEQQIYLNGQIAKTDQDVLNGRKFIDDYIKKHQKSVSPVAAAEQERENVVGSIGFQNARYEDQQKILVLLNAQIEKAKETEAKRNKGAQESISAYASMADAAGKRVEMEARSVNALTQQLALGRSMTNVEQDQAKTAEIYGKLRAAILENSKLSTTEQQHFLDKLDKELPIIARKVVLEREYAELLKREAEGLRAVADASAGTRALENQIAAIKLGEDGALKYKIQIAEAEAALDGLTEQEKARADAKVGTLRQQLKLTRDLRLEQAADAGSAAAMADSTKAMESFEKRFNETAKGIQESLTDALMGAFEEGKGFASSFMDFLRNAFKSGVKLVINAAMEPIAQGISGLVQPLMSKITGGGGIRDLFGGIFSQGSGIGGGQEIGATAAQSLESDFFSGDLISKGVASLAPTAVSAAAPATGITGILGSIPGWGWAAMAAAAVVGLSQKPGGPKVGGSFDYDVNTGKNLRSYTPSGGDEGGVGKMAEAFSKALKGSFDLLKVSTAGLKLTTGYELDPKGTATGHYDVKLERAGKEIFSKWIEVGKDDMAAVAKGLPKLIIEAFQAGVADSDIDSVTRALAAGIDTTTASLENMDAALQTIITASENARAIFGDSTGWITKDTVAAAGGLDKFAAGLAALQGPTTLFAQLAARESDLRKQLTADMAELGQTTPETMAQLRALAVSLDDTSDPTGNLRAQLVALAPELAKLEETVAAIITGITGWDAAGTGKALFDAVFSAENATEAGNNFQQAFQESFATTMAGFITQQVGQMVFQSIITPMVQSALQQAALVQAGGATAGAAMTTGGSVAGGKLAGAVGAIKDYLNAMKDVLNDPGVKQIFADLGASLNSVGVEMFNFASSTNLLKPAFKPADKTGGASAAATADKEKKDAEDLAKFMKSIQGDLALMGKSDFDKTLAKLAQEWQDNTDKAKELADTSEELARLTGDLATINELYAQQLDAARKAEKERLDALELESQKTMAGITVNLLQALMDVSKGIQDFVDRLDTDILALKKVDPKFDAVGDAAAKVEKAWSDLLATGQGEQNTPEVLNKQLALAEKLRGAIMDRYNTELDAIKKASEATKTQLKLAVDLRDYLNKLRLGELSTLDPAAKVAEGERQFSEILRRAQAGDTVAQGKLGDTADAYLKAASDYFASSVGYAQIFDTVTGALGQFTQPAKTTEELLAELNAQESDYNDKALQLAQRTQAELESIRAGALIKLGDINTAFAGVAESFVNYLGKNSPLYKAVVETLPEELAKMLGLYVAPKGVPTTSTGGISTTATVIGAGIQGLAPGQTGPTAGPSLGAAMLAAEAGDIVGALANAASLGFNTQQMADAWNAAHPENLTTAQGLTAFAQSQGLPGFAMGNRDVARDQLAMVHAGEMVFDRATADAMRRYGVSTDTQQTGLDDEAVQAIVAEGKAQVRQNAEAYPAIIEELRAMRLELAELKSAAKLEKAQ